MAAPEKKSSPQQTFCLERSGKEVFEPPVSVFPEFLILSEVFEIHWFVMSDMHFWHQLPSKLSLQIHPSNLLKTSWFVWKCLKLLIFLHPSYRDCNTPPPRPGSLLQSEKTKWKHVEPQLLTDSQNSCLWGHSRSVVCPSKLLQLGKGNPAWTTKQQKDIQIRHQSFWEAKNTHEKRSTSFCFLLRFCSEELKFQTLCLIYHSGLATPAEGDWKTFRRETSCVIQRLFLMKPGAVGTDEFILGESGCCSHRFPVMWRRSHSQSECLTFQPQFRNSSLDGHEPCCIQSSVLTG